MKNNFSGRTLGFLNNTQADEANGRCNWMSATDLERAAGNMSNYSGGGGYTGFGDEFLDFGGGDNGSFMDAINKGRVYNLTLTNSQGSGVTRVALICPGLISTATGLIADGAFNAVGGGSGLSAVGAPQSIAFFNAYIQRFPTRVIGFKISSTNANQLEQLITIQRQTPFETAASVSINLGMYASEVNPNQNLLTVAYEFQLDNETQISYPVLDGATVSFGIVFGPSLKTTSALSRKNAAGAATKASFTGR